ncbi:MAG TPA: rod shape-determining protein MreD [Acidimicrobiales bacterium]|nr:rod shape-determining protein MreD [Acidimicrobiales bacterium]
MEGAALTADARFRAPLVVVTVLVLHLAVLSRLRVFGVTPDVMLLLAVAAGLRGGPSAGAAMGFTSGMAVDLFLDTPLGLSALVFTLVGFAMGTVGTGILRAAWWIPVVAAFVASAAGEAFFAVAGYLVGQTEMVTARLALIAPVVGVLNAVLAPPVVRMAGWALVRSPGPRAFVG